SCPSALPCWWLDSSSATVLLIAGFRRRDSPSQEFHPAGRARFSRRMLRFNVTLLYVFVAFPIAYAVLKRWLFVPLMAILDARERDEATAARVHAESLEELQKTIAAAERELARARMEALKEREKLRAEGRTQWERRLAEAQTSAR